MTLICNAASGETDGSGSAPRGSLIAPVKVHFSLFRVEVETAGARRFQAAQARPPVDRLLVQASASIGVTPPGMISPGSRVLSAVAARAPHVGVQGRTDPGGVRGRRAGCVGAISSWPCVPAGPIRGGGGAILCAIGHNCRLLLAWFRRLLARLLLSAPHLAATILRAIAAIIQPRPHREIPAA